MDKVDKVLHRMLTILFAKINQFKSIKLSSKVGYRHKRGQNDIYFIFFKLQYTHIIFIDFFLMGKIIFTTTISFIFI